MKFVNSIILLFLVIVPVRLFAWNYMYITGEMNGWTSNPGSAISMQKNLNNQWWHHVYKSTNDDSYFEWKFVGSDDGSFSWDKSYGDGDTNVENTGDTAEGPSSGTGNLEGSVSSNVIYIFSFDTETNGATAGRYELTPITNVALCGQGFVKPSITWTPSDEQNSMYHDDNYPEIWYKVVFLSNGQQIQFKFAPNDSLSDPISPSNSWAFGDSDSTLGPDASSGYSYMYGGTNLTFTPSETGYYQIEFNIVTGHYEIKKIGVVINELMWMGSAASTADEWIELWNYGGSDVYIGGWVVWQSSGYTITIPYGTVLSNGRYYLIANYDDDSSSSHLNIQPDLVDTAVSLPNTGLQVKLYTGPTNSSVVIDTADDGSGTPLAGVNNTTAGYRWSMARKYPITDGTLASSWFTSTNIRFNWDAGSQEFGTPGRTNWYRLPNAWHIPGNYENQISSYMRNPVFPYSDGINVAVHQGIYKAYGTNQTGGTIYWRTNGAVSWNSLPLSWETNVPVTGGTNQYWTNYIYIPTSYTNDEVVEYYIKLTFDDGHDTTYICGYGTNTNDFFLYGWEETARSNTFRFIVKSWPNCWHIPKNGPVPYSSDTMRSPLNPSAGDTVKIYTGSQFQGGNNANQTGGVLYYTTNGSTTWWSTNLYFYATAGNDKYWQTDIPIPDSWTNGVVLKYYIKMEYDNRKDVYLYGTNNQSHITNDESYAKSNPYILVINSPPTRPILTTPSNGDNQYYARRPKFIWQVPYDYDGDEITNYQLVLSTNSDLSSPVTNVQTFSTNPWWQCSVYLELNTTYYWAVRAWDGLTWGGWSSTNSFVINPPYISIDTNISEWGDLAVSSTNRDAITNGQWQWLDASDDHRTDHDDWAKNAEITEFRMTGDQNRIYFMFKNVYMTDPPLTHISVAIDTNRVNGSGQSWLGFFSETYVNPNAFWEREAFANVDHTGVYHPDGTREEVGENWITPQSPAGPSYGEVGIPWDAVGVSPPVRLRFTVSFAEYDGNSNKTYEITGSDMVDTITTNGGSAWGDLQDSTNDFYFEVDFRNDGRVVEHHYEIECPTNVWAGVPFNITVKAKTYLGGPAYVDSSFTLLGFSIDTDGDLLILSNSGWSGDSITYTVILNSVGTNTITVSNVNYVLAVGYASNVVCNRPDIHINEVCFDPLGADDGNEWFEVYNNDTNSIHLTNWAWFDRDGTFPKFVVNKNVVMPPNSFLVFHDGTGTDDLDLSDGRGIIYGEWGLSVLGGADDVSLYCSGQKENSATLIDYMAYGGDAGADDDLAVSCGLWTDGDFASTNGYQEGASLMLTPDGNDNNLGTDWHIDVSPTPQYSNSTILAEHLSVITQSDGGYRLSRMLVLELIIPDPDNDAGDPPDGDTLNKLVVKNSGNLTPSEIYEVKLWNDGGAGQFNYGYSNSTKPPNLFISDGYFSNDISSWVFECSSNSSIPASSSITLYVSFYLRTNAVVGRTINIFVPEDGIYLASTSPYPSGPADASVSNGYFQQIKSGMPVIYEVMDGRWAGTSNYYYQFVEVYNNSDTSLDPVALGWQISARRGSDALSYFRGSSLGAGAIGLITGGGSAVSNVLDYYSENTNSPVLITPDSKIGTYGLSVNDSPVMLREGNTILGIVDYTNSATTLTQTMERINPYGVDDRTNFEPSSWINGTPGYLNGFKAVEMSIQNVSNYVLEYETTNNLVLSFVVPNDGGVGGTLEMLTVHNNGTAVDTDIALNLWKDGTSEGWNGDESLVGSMTYDGNSRWKWSGSTSIPAGGVRFFITASALSSLVDGRTVRLEVEQLKPVWPSPYSGTFTNGVSVASFNDGPVDDVASNVSYQICGRGIINVSKVVDSIELGGSPSAPIPGSLVMFKITYSNDGNGKGKNVVIYDKIPDNTTYYTNYLGTAVGWTVEYSGLDNPDQSYSSSDYSTTKPAVVKWIRWKKETVETNEDGKTMFLGVVIE